jgi:hypothetical protein
VIQDRQTVYSRQAYLAAPYLTGFNREKQMKKMLLLLLVISHGLLADEIRSVELVSPMNYMLPALELKVQDGRDELELIVKGAVLFYPDPGGTTNQFSLVGELAKLFEFEGADSLVFKLKKAHCTAKDISAKEQVFSCSNFARQDVAIHAAASNFRGGLDRVSQKSLKGKIKLDVSKVKRRSVAGTSEGLEVDVSIHITRPDAQAPLSIVARKGDLILRGTQR